MKAYAVGLWTVKEGRQDDFVQAWMDLGARLRENYPERRATLLHDRDNPSLFISFGPNESLDALEGRRESMATRAQEADNTLSEYTSRLFGLLENFDLHTLDYVGEIA
jgi:hypothetical protein